MKYSELRIGDRFKIVREHENTVYVKKECSFIDLDSGKEYRKLYGGTKVRKL